MKHKTEREENYPPVKLSKHTLDSDEEDNDEDEKLNDSDVEGQEPETVDYIDEIEIMPFNMKQELAEDGHIDKDGNFVFRKSSEEKDVWLENVDWNKVRSGEFNTEKKKEENYDEDSAPISVDEKLSLYKEILNLIDDDETIIKALKRHGPKKNNQASRRWIKKKAYEPHSVDFFKLTELADKLMQAGDFEIYEKSKKQIRDLINVTATHIDDDEKLDELQLIGEQLDAKT